MATPIQSFVSLVQSETPDPEQVLNQITAIAKNGFFVDQGTSLEAVLVQMIIKYDPNKEIRLSLGKKAFSTVEKVVVIANTILKTYQAAPNRIPSELQSHPAYHGKAINEAIFKLIAGLSNLEELQNLRDFVHGYCLQVFKKNNRNRLFLIRPSSSHEDTEKAQHFSLSFFEDHRQKQILLTRHFDAVEQKTIWKTQSNSDTYLNNLIYRILPEFQPAMLLANRQLDEYVDEYVEVRSPNSEKESNAEEAWQADKIFAALQDPVSSDRLLIPVLAPDGNTFSKNHLLRWFQTQSTAFQPTKLPTTMLPCSEADLMQNPLVARILDVRVDQFEGRQPHSAIRSLNDWKEDPILTLLGDPLTQLLLDDPVMAPNGVTYSRASIEAHLSQNQGLLPLTGTLCSPEQLIPNRAIAGVLEVRKDFILSKLSWSEHVSHN